jgi:photolyase PhrII
MQISDLPDHLAERTRVTPGSATAVAGRFVLYWVHHAVRTQENPALDVARFAAHRLGLPLRVYQGLGGRHRYDSDRHHAFILEGARDLARDLTALELGLEFHLGADPAARSPLGSLARDAALVVTEDLPAPPFPAWTARLAREAGAPLWQVDTACVLPMRLVPRQPARAFEFRRACGDELLRRAALPWPELQERAAAFEDDPRFDPVDLAAADIGALCAACDIDHGVAPVSGTVGGGDAGEARWSAFLDQGLADYHRLRNDAAVSPPRGVSRISPYLHHGQLSPLRIAREASAHASEGARKFLDELLIWRELAHAFCFHLALQGRDPGRFDALPAWARRTLCAHAADPREAHYTLEELARGRTADRLWNAAQRSLRVHGELHNNLRMTWGKALLCWASPRRALRMMVELNHRYALDGSDPNSYGGLLYCLGLFDRPFLPPQPVYGSVRARSSAAHARRLDLPRFEAHLARRGAAEVAVVGAGIAGLAAARSLQDQGHAVRVFERGRGAGGRAATRRREAIGFDHGAQFFTARDPAFRRQVTAWAEAGHVAPWWPRVVRLPHGTPTTRITRYVGVPGMSAVAGHLARDLEVIAETAVTSLSRKGGRWRLHAQDAELPGEYDAVVIAAAPEQAARLLPAPTPLRHALSAHTSLACWCAMAAFPEPLPLPFDAAFIDDTELMWCARDSSKPGRGAGERWVLHASAGWSGARLQADRDEVAEALLQRFFAIAGIDEREPVALVGHRWGLARCEQPATQACLWDGDRRLAICGDWCVTPRVEGAWLSGVAAAGRIAGR